MKHWSSVFFYFHLRTSVYMSTEACSYQWSSPCAWRWWGCASNPVFSSGALTTHRTSNCWSVSRKENEAGEGMEHNSFEKQLRKLRAFSLEQRNLRGDLIALFNYLKGGCSNVGNGSPLTGNKQWEEMLSNFARGDLDWMLGKISLLKGWSSIGTGCSGKWLSHHSWRYLRGVDVDLGTQFSGERVVLGERLYLMFLEACPT